MAKKATSVTDLMFQLYLPNLQTQSHFFYARLMM